MVRAPEAGGYGIDALWNDDFHHSGIVAMTGRNEAYYTDYRGTAQEFVSAAKYGYLYQGQRYKWQKKSRGAPAFDLNPWNFVAYLQNHDQIANSARGERLNLLTHPATVPRDERAAAAGSGDADAFPGPGVRSHHSFPYFCDHERGSSCPGHAGRREFLSQFRSPGTPEMQRGFAIQAVLRPSRCPGSIWSEREKNPRVFTPVSKI